MPNSKVEDARAQFEMNRDLEAAKRYLTLAIEAHNRRELWDSELTHAICNVGTELVSETLREFGVRHA